MTASAEALARVDGIGQKTAAKMRSAVEEPTAEYRQGACTGNAPGATP